MNPSTPKKESSKKLRPLSLSKLPRLPCLSKGLPPFQIDKPSTSPSSSSSNNNRYNRIPQPNTTDCHQPHDWTNPPPRTNWNVSDSNLRSIPPYHPPMVPSDCTFVTDASASVVAARIVHCLRKRSLIADYDDEKAYATVFDVDTGSFGIALYQGNQHGPRTNILRSGSRAEDTVPPDFSQGVVVECTRIRGDVVLFHRNCRAVLASARGESDGLEEFRNSVLGGIRTSAFGFNRVVVGRDRDASSKDRNQRTGREVAHNGWDPIHVSNGLLPPPRYGSPRSPSKPSSSRESTTASLSPPQSDMAQSVCISLQKALSRLENDGRFDLQLLGLQSLALLTDVRSSRLEKAYLSSLCVLGSPMTFAASLDMNYSPDSLALGGCDKDGLREKEEEEEREEDASAFAITRIHERVRAIVMQKDHNHTMDLQSSSQSPDEYPSSCLSTDDASSVSKFSSSTSHAQQPQNPELHLSMRRTAIQSFINALSTILSYSDRFPLLPPLHCETLHRDEFIQCLALDVTGATRPPMATMPLLGNAHDAALSTQLLDLIVTYHKNRRVRNNHEDNMRRKNIHEGNIGDTTVGIPPRKLSDLLERARVVGLSCHGFLEVTAERALRNLGIESKS